MSATSSVDIPLEQAIGRCRQSQQLWAGLPIASRLRPVRFLRHLVVREWEALAAAVERDLGKPPAETLAAELLPLAAACRFLEKQAGHLLRPRSVPARQRPLWLWGQSDTVYRRPHGVVGIIGTWNYPLFLNGVQIVQALAAGNAVVWKPSEVAPASAAALSSLLVRAGIGQDLIHTLPATREAGRQLAEADVDHIVFTGSDATGRRLAATLGQRLISSTMELSGCDAMFVLNDADVDLAVRAAWFGITFNRGQTCLAVRRVFVQQPLYAAVVDALRPLAAAAAPLRLALESQARQADRLVEAALADGARLLAGPAPTSANGVAALCPVRVLVDARPEMAVCREASFAPLLAVLSFNEVAEAVRMDAACPFALGASIFTRAPAKATHVAAKLRAGTVAINDVMATTAHPATPFGGRGASGWGVTQGAEGFLEMTVPQTVSVRGGRFRPHYEPPGSSALTRLATLRGMLEWNYGATIRQRWRGLGRLLRGLPGKDRLAPSPDE
jgi:acyl-CoA reductase-like NAD-dependent aldehyde dehydrogenase